MQMMKKKVLVIDDKEAIGKLIALCLGSDYECQYFNNVLAGINWLQSGNKIDLILSDYTMPELNGYEFLVMLKQNEFLKDIPVVFLSGEEHSSTRIKLLECGAEDFILKPFNPLELKIRIKKILK